MWTGEVKSVAFTIGNWPVQWYGIILTCAMLIGLVVGTKRLKNINVTSDDTLSLFLWAIPLAVVMARLGYVVSRYEWFFTSPYDMQAFIDTIAIWDGGLTIMWGVPGGALGALIWAKIHKKDIIAVADIVLPVVLLSQALGRWGNFCNQELYGQMITNPSAQWFPLAVYISDEGAFFQATFFYELVLNLTGFFLLSYLVKHFKVKGLGSLGYITWYSLVRGSLEFIRDDGSSSFDGKVNFTMIFCFVMAAVAVISIVLLFLHAKSRGDKIFYKKGIPPLPPPENVKKPEPTAFEKKLSELKDTLKIRIKALFSKKEKGEAAENSAETKSAESTAKNVENSGNAAKKNGENIAKNAVKEPLKSGNNSDKRR